MRARWLVVIAALAGCGPSPAAQHPTGADDSDGDLARLSVQLAIHDEPAAIPAPRRNRRARTGAPYGGDPYGGAMYGGDDHSNDIIVAHTSDVPAAPAGPRYNATTGLTGAIEGTVSWRGEPPPPLVTRCGRFDNPTVRVGPDGRVGGALVYIERVETGRTLPSYGRPTSVGGAVIKRGCALSPALQILTPLPAALAIHGDASDARLRISSPGRTRPIDLQAAGRVAVPAAPGVTRVEADDGSLGVAWIVALDTPYYAITDDRGRFRIHELAAGTYDVVFWRPPVARTTEGRVDYGAPVIVHRTIHVSANRPAHLDVALGR